MDATDERIVAFIRKHPRLPLNHVAVHMRITFDATEAIYRKHILKLKPGQKRRMAYHAPEPSEEEIRLTLRTIRASERLLKRREKSHPAGPSGNGRMREYVFFGDPSKMIFQARSE